MGFTIWGCQTRLQGFFKDNAELVKESLQGEGSKKEAKKMLQNHMTQLFLKAGGFDHVSSITDKLL